VWEFWCPAGWERIRNDFPVSPRQPSAATKNDPGERGGVSPLPPPVVSTPNRGADATPLAKTRVQETHVFRTKTLLPSPLSPSPAPGERGNSKPGSCFVPDP